MSPQGVMLQEQVSNSPVGFAPKLKQLPGPRGHHMGRSHHDIIQLSQQGSDVRLISQISRVSPQNRSTNHPPQPLSMTSFYHSVTSLSSRSEA